MNVKRLLGKAYSVKFEHYARHIECVVVASDIYIAKEIVVAEYELGFGSTDKIVIEEIADCVYAEA